MTDIILGVMHPHVPLWAFLVTKRHNVYPAKDDYCFSITNANMLSESYSTKRTMLIKVYFPVAHSYAHSNPPPYILSYMFLDEIRTQSNTNVFK